MDIPNCHADDILRIRLPSGNMHLSTNESSPHEDFEGTGNQGFVISNEKLAKEFTLLVDVYVPLVVLDNKMTTDLRRQPRAVQLCVKPQFLPMNRMSAKTRRSTRMSYKTQAT